MPKTHEQPMVGLGNWKSLGNGEFAGPPVHISASLEFVAHAADSRTRYDIGTWVRQFLHLQKPAPRK